MTVPFMYNFRTLLKVKPNIVGFKNVVERGIRKILIFEIREIASKLFEK